MDRKLHKYFGPAALVLMLAVAGVGLAGQVRHDKPAAPATEGVELRRVAELKKVCMVTNRVFEKDQIPVQVEGRTYYGCCEGCKQTLAKNPAARTAVDPVSGKPVDKARAVIGAAPDGSVLYFENEANLKKYSPKAKG